MSWPEILFALAGVVIGALSTYYAARATKKQEVSRPTSGTIDVYYDRQELMGGLEAQYADAGGGDEIWGQCVSCTNYTERMPNAVIRAARDDVRFRFILNSNSRYASLAKTIGAVAGDYRLSDGVPFSCQGVSDRDLIISLPDAEHQTAIRIREPQIVKAIRREFDIEWDRLDEERAGQPESGSR